MTTTYYVHEDMNGQPAGPRKHLLGKPTYGYKFLANAIRWCPRGCVVVKRYLSGGADWSDGVMYVHPASE
jgi:hypothetical protein